MDKIWITWEDQRRNRELSKALGVKLYEFAEIDRISNIFRKYVTGIWKTIRVLWHEKPKLVYAQNPSIVLSTLVVILKNIFSFTAIIDAHNVGLFPAEGKSKILNRFSKYIQRKADIVVVTNDSLKDYVEKNGGSAFVLPDKIPDWPRLAKKKLNGKMNLLFICTFAEDEPFQEIFRAAELIEDDIYIFVTGNYTKANVQPETLPKNIFLTGYLPEVEYVRMLLSVDATIDLTTRENCLVCGAYESIAVEAPIILSNTSALKHYFHTGTVFTENSAENIAKAIYQICKNIDGYRIEIKNLKAEKYKSWEKLKQNLLNLQQTFVRDQE